MEVAVGRRRVLALALVLNAGCVHRAPALFGERIPRACAGRAGKSERCIGWIRDRTMLATAVRAYPDAELAAYVSAVGARVVSATGDRTGGWTFRVLDDPSPQANANPGRVIYVDRGAIALVRDEAELAGLLGHEIAHELAGHAHMGLVDGDVPATRTAEDERDDEIQADELGIQFAARAGYDPRGLERALRALATVAPESGEGEDAHHPAWPIRFAHVEAVAARLPATGAHDDRVLRRLLPRVVVGLDPRHQAIVGRAVVFAELGLAVDFPFALDSDVTRLAEQAVQVELSSQVAVDLRVLPDAVARYITEDNELAVTRHRARGQTLVISGVGDHARVHMIGAAVRAVRPDELAQIHPRFVDLTVPRALATE